MSVSRAVGRTTLLVALLLGVSGDPLNAQDQMAGTLDEARALVRAEDFVGAVAILEAITAAEPESASAWSLLGYALHQNGELDRALDAHFKAAAFEETAPIAMYNIGLTYSMKGDADQAFEWLFRARDTGRLDVTRIGLSADAENIYHDPRFTELFPSEEQYADPFVENVEILREWTGEAIGDQFGWIARNIGDVDDDGVNDVATSAPSKYIGGQHAGRIYAFSGRTGERLWWRDGRPGDRFGLGIEAAGDVNADGIPDIVVGAPGGGNVHVYNGRTGRMLLTLYGSQVDELFGRKVAGIGDIDGDGHDDILVGAPLNDAAGEDAGRAYVFSGANGSLLLALNGERAGDRFGNAVAGFHDGIHTFLVVGAPDAGAERRGRAYVYRDLSGEPAFIIESDETGAELGAMFVSVLGDIDGDDVPDVYASDWSNAAIGPSTGRIFVHSGADGRRLLTLTGEAAGDGFGIGTADAGDVNGDGHDDLIVGAWQHSSVAPSGGKVYLFSGEDASLIRAYTGKVMGESFGFDTTGMGDVDGDGAIDFLLTSAWSAISGSRSGRVYIVSGKDIQATQP